MLGSKATCTCNDLGSAELWLASAVSIGQGLRLVSDILQDTLAGLQRTGIPAFTSQDLPDLCFTTLEALHSNPTFQGCLTRGLTPTGLRLLAWQSHAGSDSLSRNSPSQCCRARSSHICMHSLAGAEASKTLQIQHGFLQPPNIIIYCARNGSSRFPECFQLSIYCSLQPALEFLRFLKRMICCRRQPDSRCHHRCWSATGRHPRAPFTAWCPVTSIRLWRPSAASHSGADQDCNDICAELAESDQAQNVLVPFL